MFSCRFLVAKGGDFDRPDGSPDTSVVVGEFMDSRLRRHLRSVSAINTEPERVVVSATVVAPVRVAMACVHMTTKRLKIRRKRGAGRGGGDIFFFGFGSSYG